MRSAARPAGAAGLVPALIGIAAIAAAGCGAYPAPRAVPETPGATAMPAAPTPREGTVGAAPASGPTHAVHVPGPVPLTLSVPATWTLQGTVFVDGDRKVAELSPGAAPMPDPRACTDWPGPDPADDPTRILQQTPVAFGALHGLRRVEQAPFEGDGTVGAWYPVAYCLRQAPTPGQVGTGYGLYITFYAAQDPTTGCAAFDRIAASAVFA